jgi:hypothetical protein
VICNVPGAFPLAGEIVSQGTSAAVVKFSVPPPVFARFTVVDPGLVPPCCAEKFKLLGITESTGDGAFTVTVALDDLLVSAVLVALIVTVWSLLTAGAVNKPALVALPAVAVQVTARLLLLATVAANCWIPPDYSDTAAGVIETVTQLRPPSPVPTGRS